MCYKCQAYQSHDDYNTTSIGDTDKDMSKTINANRCRLICRKKKVWILRRTSLAKISRGSIIFYKDNDDAIFFKKAFVEELHVHTTFGIVERPVS